MTFPMETFRNTTIDRTISLFREVTQPNLYISIRRFAQEYPFILFSAISFAFLAVLLAAMSLLG